MKRLLILLTALLLAPLATLRAAPQAKPDFNPNIIYILCNMQ